MTQWLLNPELSQPCTGEPEGSGAYAAPGTGSEPGGEFKLNVSLFFPKTIVSPFFFQPETGKKFFQKHISLQLANVFFFPPLLFPVWLIKKILNIWRQS